MTFNLARLELHAPSKMATSRQQTSATAKKVVDYTGQDESSDSDGETEPARIFHRRISTNKDIKTSVSSEAVCLVEYVYTGCYVSAPSL